MYFFLTLISYLYDYMTLLWLDSTITWLYDNVLLRTTEFYTVLLRTTKYYTVLQSITQYYSVLQSTTQYYSVLQGTTP